MKQNISKFGLITKYSIRRQTNLSTINKTLLQTTRRTNQHPSLKVKLIHFGTLNSINCHQKKPSEKGENKGYNEEQSNSADLLVNSTISGLASTDFNIFVSWAAVDSRLQSLTHSTDYSRLMGFYVIYS